MRGTEVKEKEPVSSANKPLRVRTFPRRCPPSPCRQSVLSILHLEMQKVSILCSWKEEQDEKIRDKGGWG